MYKVFTYEVKKGLFGTNMEKADRAMEEFLNEQDQNGWELVSLSEMNTDTKTFIYKMVFKKK